jgi:two-component system cell cycle response regulator DivK
MAAENPSHIKMINILTKSFELSNMKPFGLIHILDDDEQIRSVIGMILVRTGYTVATYESPHAYLAQSHEPQREVMLLDIRMPGMSGIEAIRHLRSDDRLSHTPIIAITAFAMKGDEEKIRLSGCQGYISKPISVAKFLETINTLLS